MIETSKTASKISSDATQIHLKTYIDASLDAGFARWKYHRNVLRRSHAKASLGRVQSAAFWVFSARFCNFARCLIVPPKRGNIQRSGLGTQAAKVVSFRLSRLP